MIGIILSGGNGSRLFPSTNVVSKQLHCVYDKPMIYYSLSLLINFNIKKIIIISNVEYLSLYEKLLGNGSKYGVKITYLAQSRPRGIAEALIISRKYITNKNVCLLLGDNIFYSKSLNQKLPIIKSNLEKDKSTIIGYHIKDPNEYGVVQFKKNKIFKIIEKPKKFISNIAVTGLYFYPKSIIDYTKNLNPSKRGELEITSVNNRFLDEKKLEIEILEEGDLWMDLGNHTALLRGSQFIEAVENRQGFKIGCIEENALKQGFITKEKLKKLLTKYPDSQYKKYLNSII